MKDNVEEIKCFQCGNSGRKIGPFIDTASGSKPFKFTRHKCSNPGCRLYGQFIGDKIIGVVQN